MASSTYTINVETTAAIRSINQLNSALAGLATGIVVKGFTEIIDKTTNLTNKLTQVTQEGQNSAQLFALMTKTANSLSVPLKDVSDLFFRIANNTRDLGLAQTDQLRLTELLNKAFQLTGLTTAEASASVLQFGQALAVGTVNGDELRSILENAPPVAQALAKSLGVTVGALKELGSQGKISSRQLVNAMLEAGDGIDAAYKDRIPTISGAWSVFGNTVDSVVDKFNKQHHVVEGVAIAIIKLSTVVINISNFFDKWGTRLYVFGGVIAAVFLPFKLIPPIIAVVEGAFTALGGAFTAISMSASALFGMLAAGEGIFGSLGAALITFFTEIGSGIKTIAGMVAALLGIPTAIQYLSHFFKDLGIEMFATEHSTSKYQQALDDLNKALGVDNAEASEKATKATGGLTAAQLKMQKQTESTIASLKKSYKDMNDALSKETATIGMGDEQKGRLEGQLDMQKKLTDAITAYKDKAKEGGLKEDDPTVLKGIKDLNDEHTKAIALYDQEYDKKVKATRADELRKFSLDSLYESQNKLKAIQDEINTTTMPTAQKQYYELKRAAEDAAEAQIRTEAARRGIKVEEMPIEDVKAYYAAAAQGIDGLIQKQAELNKVRESENLRLFNLKEQYDLQDKLKSLQDDINKSTMTDLEKKYYDIETAANASAQAELRAAAARANINVEDLPKDQYKAIVDSATKGVDKLKAKTKEAYNDSRSFSTGWKKAFNDYVESATDASKQAERVFTKATQGMEDALVEFAKTGKFEWKGFLNSILEELLRSQIKQTIANVFGGSGTSNNSGGSGGNILGSIFSSIGGLLGFAEGGIIPTTGPVLVGERGPEIISGVGGRTVIPNDQLGTGGSTVVNYTIHATDANSFKQMLAQDPSFLYAVTMQGARSIPGRR
jgi:lambda family phage tail tape measure protein